MWPVGLEELLLFLICYDYKILCRLVLSSLQFQAFKQISLILTVFVTKQSLHRLCQFLLQ